jgi:hypothetical protein
MPEKLKDLQYDNIVIAVSGKAIAQQIKSELIGMGIQKDKILWNKTKSKWEL